MQDLKGLIKRLKKTPGVDLRTSSLGRRCSEEALARAEARLGASLGPLRRIYAENNGFSVRWSSAGIDGELGLLSLAKMVARGSPEAFEDVLWNDEFEAQIEGSPEEVAHAQAVAKRLRLLWDTELGDDRALSVLFAPDEEPSLFFGGTNEHQPLDLSVEEYFSRLVECGGLDLLPCFVGTEAERAAARIDLRTALRETLPGWPIPEWLDVPDKEDIPPGPEAFSANIAHNTQLLHQGEGSPEQVRFSADGRWLIAAGHGRLFAIDMARGAVAWTIDAGVQRFALSPRGDRVAVAESRFRRRVTGESLFLRAIESGEKLNTRAFRLPGSEGIEALAFAAEGGLSLASGSRHWAITPGTWEQHTTWERPELWGIATIEHAGKGLVIAEPYEGGVSWLDAATGAPQHRWPAGGFALAPDHRTIALCLGDAPRGHEGQQRRVVLADTTSGETIHTIEAQGPGPQALRAAFSPDGTLLAIAETPMSGGQESAIIRTFSVGSWAHQRTLELGRDPLDGRQISVFGLAITPHRLLCAATHSHGLRFFQL